MNEASYVYGGARALVQLHARHLLSFVDTWKRATAAGTELPPSEDPDCQSLDTLLRHVLGAARGYMVWICRSLELGDPAIDPVPDDLAADVDTYAAHVLDRWDGPLHGLDQKTVDRATFPSSWGVDYCIDAMLEHAVMHPIRHQLQLERAMAAGPKNGV